MFLPIKLLSSAFLIFLTACQLNLKVTDDESNRFKVNKLEAANFYMHNATGVRPDELEVYLDRKRVNLEKLDISGLKLKPGKHSLEIKNKKSREPADHFEFELENENNKHIYLCIDPNQPNHYKLISEKNKNCIDPKNSR